MEKNEAIERPERLYRSQTNKVLFGVLGGIGEYFNIDPVIFRLVFIFGTFMSGVVPGILAYIVSIFIVPKQPLVIN